MEYFLQIFPKVLVKDSNNYFGPRLVKGTKKQECLDSPNVVRMGYPFLWM